MNRRFSDRLAAIENRRPDAAGVTVTRQYEGETFEAARQIEHGAPAILGLHVVIAKPGFRPEVLR